MWKSWPKVTSRWISPSRRLVDLQEFQVFPGINKIESGNSRTWTKCAITKRCKCNKIQPINSKIAQWLSNMDKLFRSRLWSINRKGNNQYWREVRDLDMHLSRRIERILILQQAATNQQTLCTKTTAAPSIQPHKKLYTRSPRSAVMLNTIPTWSKISNRRSPSSNSFKMGGMSSLNFWSSKSAKIRLMK